MFKQKWWLWIGIVVGVAVLFAAIKLRPQAKVEYAASLAHLVDVAPLALREVAPHAYGYGRVVPLNEWQAITEVQGEVVYLNPALQSGRILTRGTLLLRIDDRDYQLAFQRASARLASAQQQFKRLTKLATNLDKQLRIETQRLALAEEELARKLALSQQKLLSNSELEAEKQRALAQRHSVQELQNSLNLLPEEQLAQQAQVDVEMAEVANAQRLLDKTEIYLPFDARIANVSAELNQVVSTAQSLVEAYRIDVMEVEVQLSLSDMRRLLRSISPELPQGQFPQAEHLGIGAQLHIDLAGEHYAWQAKVSRIAESIDTERASLGVFLEVEQDLSQINLATQIPLAKGMFVEATLLGQVESHFMVPERALHGQHVYVLGAEQQLEIIPVEVLFRVAGEVAVKGPLTTEMQIVLSDLIPAVPGMRLRTEERP